MTLCILNIYFRVFTELGESFLIKTVSAPPSQPHFSLPILHIMILILCTSWLRSPWCHFQPLVPTLQENLQDCEVCYFGLKGIKTNPSHCSWRPGMEQRHSVRSDRRFTILVLKLHNQPLLLRTLPCTEMDSRYLKNESVSLIKQVICENVW